MAISKEMLFSAGEGLDFADLNAMQRFLRAQTHDIWRAYARQSDPGGGVNPQVLYTQGNGGAPYATGASRQLGNYAGWIAVTQGLGVTGDAPDFLYYYVALNEMAVTLDVGHATDHRTDILCVKLDYLDGGSESRDFEDAATRALSSTTPNKRRNVRLQFQVVKGADNPVFPGTQGAVPVGYVKIAAVYIPPTWNAAIAPGNILDYTMPVGFKIIDIPGPQWDHISNSDTATAWIAQGGQLGRYHGGYPGAIPAYAICPGLPNSHRIIGVGFGGIRRASSTATVELRRIDLLPADATVGYAEAVITPDYAGSALLPTTGSDTEYREISLLTGEPIWVNGYRSGVAASELAGLPPYTSAPPFSPPAIPRCALRYLTDGTRDDQITLARFYVAGGM